MDFCSTDCSALCQVEAYHVVFPQQVLEEEIPISKLEVLNVAVAVKLWAPTLAVRRVILHSDSLTVVMIFQACRDRKSHIQVCARDI